MRPALRFGIAFLVFACLLTATPDPARPDRTHFVRIAAYPLAPNSAEKIVQAAKAGNVFGIEVDNDTPGRYESFLDPRQKLQTIRAVAEKSKTTYTLAPIAKGAVVWFRSMTTSP